MTRSLSNFEFPFLIWQPALSSSEAPHSQPLSSDEALMISNFTSTICSRKPYNSYQRPSICTVTPTPFIIAPQLVEVEFGLQFRDVSNKVFPWWRGSTKTHVVRSIWRFWQQDSTVTQIVRIQVFVPAIEAAEEPFVLKDSRWTPICEESVTALVIVSVHVFDNLFNFLNC
jgi:hypothetical protein